MSYIENDLLDGETILYSGQLHWRIYLAGYFHLFLSVVLFVISKRLHMPVGYLLGAVFMLLSIFSLINAAITKYSTELAVTNKRVIFKTGLFSRRTMELSHHRIESIRENQSITGRILGYGSIIVEGTGGGQESLANISDPMAFKKHAQAAAEAAVSAEIPK